MPPQATGICVSVCCPLTFTVDFCLFCLHLFFPRRLRPCLCPLISRDGGGYILLPVSTDASNSMLMWLTDAGSAELGTSFDWPCLSMFTHYYSWFAGILAGSSRQKSFSNNEYFPCFFCITELMNQGLPLLLFALGPTTLRQALSLNWTLVTLGKACWPVCSQVLSISDR